jgi:hypothetical protein
VTPAIYYLSRPYGDLTNGQSDAFGGDRQNNRNNQFNNFGGLLKTTFKF